MTRKTRNTIIIIVSIFVILLCGTWLVYSNFSKIANTAFEDEKYDLAEGVDEFGNKFEVYTYDTEETLCVVNVYSPEDNTKHWVIQDLEGKSEINYAKYEEDHYVISFVVKASPCTAALTFIDIEDGEHSHDESYTKQFNVYTIKFTKDDNNSVHTEVTPAILSDEYTPSENTEGN